MAILSFLGFLLNTLLLAVIGCSAVLLAKLLIPIRGWRRLCDRALVAISYSWTHWNTRVFRTFSGFEVAPEIAPGIELARDRRYLILPNHQSWTDIFVLQALFHPKTPFLTFFLKRQLLYIPFFGVIWWALGFPFMQRRSSAYLEKHPEERGQDLETTRRFCEKIRAHPFAVINFVEGTRRTPAKAAKSPYKHLLAPKAGGIAIALQALDYQFDHVLEVTLQYASAQTRFVDLLAGRLGKVRAIVRELPLSEIPRGDYFSDPAFAERFRAWLNEAWRRKDAEIEAASP